MKIDHDVTLSGFICIPRSILPGLVKELGLSGLAKYIILLSQADFDKKHKHYSKIIRSDDKIGSEFGISPSTIYKSRSQLAKKGLVIHDSGVSSIPSMEAFDSRLLVASSKKKIPIDIEMLKDWRLFEEKHQEYVDGLKPNQVQNDH
jgi:hypothetical protein